MTSFQININPMGSVRMTQAGKWVKPNAIRYLNYKQVLALEAKKHFKEPLQGPLEVEIHFYVQPPKKMPKGRTRPTVKPDIDNLIKGVMDSLNKIAWNDDAQVVSVKSSKWYHEDEPSIYIEVASGI